MISVVTQGPFHERLLCRLLSDLAHSSVEVIDGHGRDAARPLARQVSLLERRPVVFAIDADTVEAGQVRQQQADLDYYFGWSAGGLPFQVVQFVPTLEVIFFDRRRVLERLLGRNLEPAVAVAGEIAPRAVLQRILPEVGNNLIERIDDLTDDDLRQLRSHPAIVAIRRFVEENAEPTLLRRSA